MPSSSGLGENGRALRLTVNRRMLTVCFMAACVFAGCLTPMRNATREGQPTMSEHEAMREMIEGRGSGSLDKKAMNAAMDECAMADCVQWIQATFEGGAGDLPTVLTNAGEPPFSFTYGGKSSADLLKTWKFKRERRALDAKRVQHTLLWTDPHLGYRGHYWKLISRKARL